MRKACGSIACCPRSSATLTTDRRPRVGAVAGSPSRDMESPKASPAMNPGRRRRRPVALGQTLCRGYLPDTGKPEVSVSLGPTGRRRMLCGCRGVAPTLTRRDTADGGPRPGACRRVPPSCCPRSGPSAWALGWRRPIGGPRAAGLGRVSSAAGRSPSYPQGRGKVIHRLRAPVRLASAPPASWRCCRHASGGRTPANFGGQMAGGLSRLPDYRSRLAIGRKPAPMLTFPTSRLSRLVFAGERVHERRNRLAAGDAGGPAPRVIHRLEPAEWGTG